jgi:hypothetical protein
MYGLRFVTLGQLMDNGNYGNPQAFTSAAVRSHDPNLKPMVNNEFALEYRRSYQGGSHFRAAYIYRVQSSLWTGRQDYTRDSWVVLDYPAGHPDLAGYPTDNNSLRPRYAAATHYFNTTDLWRDYHGLEFESVTRINSIFTLNINYSYSRLRGNNELAGSNEGASGYYLYESHLKDVPIETRSARGALNADLPHIASVGLLAVVPMGAKGSWISYSFILGYDSGSNWNAYGSAALPSTVSDTYNYYNNLYNTSGEPAPVGEPTTWTKWYAGRGAYHRNDNYWTTAAISWEVPIWKKVRTMGSVSISNVFNTIYHTDYNRDFAPRNPSESDGLWLESARFGGYRNDVGDISYINSPRSASLSIGLKF